MRIEEGLEIWKEEKYRRLQGIFPVIYLSFADVKQENYEDAVAKIKRIITKVFQQNIFLMESDKLTRMQKIQFEQVTPKMDDVTAQSSLQDLSQYLSQHYGKKVLLLLDEFDTPMQEVFTALDEFGMDQQRKLVKQWYDGFVFGEHRDIYNPWSITNYLKEKKVSAYWAATSSNGLVNRLIRTASSNVKELMEELLNENEIVVSFDEQIVFNQLDKNENAIWSLMVAAGYLRIEETEYRGILRTPWYHLKITNLETLSMYSEMFQGWFSNSESNYNAFIRAMFRGNVKEMNAYMNEIALATFSSFDTGNHPSGKSQQEKFYHGFVLGLLVELRDRYEVKSNRESGYGRYDVMLVPRSMEDPAIVFEFKVFNPENEKKLEDTVQSALNQIEEMQYDAGLIEKGVDKERIAHYGLAFKGKRVLIGTR